MNNRYLYRAKRTDNGEWVEGYLFDDGFKNGRMFVGGLVIEEYKGTAFDDWIITGIDFYEVDPSTICQCTGKTDIEKNLIFEHDVVSFLDMTSTDNGYSERCQVGEVLWDDETVSFQVTERLSAESYEVLEDCKVLGNTIDNPELLEVGE